jgi:hypothetical protein
MNNAFKGFESRRLWSLWDMIHPVIYSANRILNGLVSEETSMDSNLTFNPDDKLEEKPKNALLALALMGGGRPSYFRIYQGSSISSFKGNKEFL